jgi:hypothetical protein
VAGGGATPPGGLNCVLNDGVEAPGANYNFPKTYVNLVFGGADNSSAIAIGQDLVQQHYQLESAGLRAGWPSFAGEYAGRGRANCERFDKPLQIAIDQKDVFAVMFHVGTDVFVHPAKRSEAVSRQKPAN